MTTISKMNSKSIAIICVPQIPGKLNMGDFQKVSAALTGMKLDASPGSGGGKGSANRSPSTSKDDSIDQHGYAVPRDSVVNATDAAAPSTPSGPARVPVMVADATTGNEYAQPIALGAKGTPPPPPPPNADKSKAKQHRERREQMALQNGEKIVIFFFNRNSNVRVLIA